MDVVERGPSRTCGLLAEWMLLFVDRCQQLIAPGERLVMMSLIDGGMPRRAGVLADGIRKRDVGAPVHPGCVLGQ